MYSQPLRRKATKRDTTNVCSLGSGGIKYRKCITTQPVQRVRSGSRLRSPVPSNVVPNHTKRTLERFPLRRPEFNGCSKRVQQQANRRVFRSLDLNDQPAPTDHDLKHFHPDAAVYRSSTRSMNTRAEPR